MNPVDFARGLADAWNRRAIEEVLAHFDDRVLWAEERRELAIIYGAPAITPA